MLRLLNKMALPNTVDFSLTAPIYNEMALLAGYNIKQRKFKSESKLLVTAKANNYIAKQFKRAKKHAEKGNFEAFNKVSLNLLQNSTSYLIYSLNSVLPKWTSMDFRKVIVILIRTRKLTKTLATDINYKRVWIDKKPGDYARPLGVPEVVWRIYLRMVTNQGEIFAHGRDLYHPSQHGGRAGYGVMSCLKDVATRLNSGNYSRVYEFDIKGFFDHISHASMTTIFKGTYLEGLYEKMLKSKPLKYTLPPEDKDVALSKFNAIKEAFFEDDWGVNSPTPADYGFQTFYDFSRLPSGITGLNAPKYVTFDEVEEWDEVIAKAMKPIELKDKYKDLMSPQGTFTRRVGNSIHGEISVAPATLEDRAQGRDNWKDLNLPSQGVPQGTNFGPFLSSLAVSIYYKGQALKDWIMYIDDGLIFHNTTEELKEKLARLNKALNKMSVELAPEKSRLHTYESLKDNSIKFLGIRFKNTPGTMVSRRNFFTISSDTRSGTKKLVPEINADSMLQILENMLLEGAITISKYKYAKWAVQQSRMRGIFESDVVTLAIKYNFFGYLLSWVYNPEVDFESMRNKINEGIVAAEQTILKQTRSMGSYVLRQSSWNYTDSTGMNKNVVPDLNNHSTLCVELLLESLQFGHVSLREQGLEKRQSHEKSKGTPQIPKPSIHDKNWQQFLKEHSQWVYERSRRKSKKDDVTS